MEKGLPKPYRRIGKEKGFPKPFAEDWNMEKGLSKPFSQAESSPPVLREGLGKTLLLISGSDHTETRLGESEECPPGQLNLNGLESEGFKMLEILHVSGRNSPAECESGGSDHCVGFPFSSPPGLVEQIGSMLG